MSSLSRPLRDLPRLPGCLFAPPGDGPRSLFAENAGGALRHISEVERGTKGLTCPDCRTPLIARKGRIKVSHFAHASSEECRTAGETALHRLAKEIIAGGGALGLPNVVARGPEGSLLLHRAQEMTFDRVEVEPWQDGIRPDLIAIKAVTLDGRPEERWTQIRDAGATSHAHEIRATGPGETPSGLRADCSIFGRDVCVAVRRLSSPVDGLEQPS